MAKNGLQEKSRDPVPEEAYWQKERKSGCFSAEKRLRLADVPGKISLLRLPLILLFLFKKDFRDG